MQKNVLNETSTRRERQVQRKKEEILAAANSRLCGQGIFRRDHQRYRQ